MRRIEITEAALDHAYKELDRFKTLRTMMDKIHCDIEVWFTDEEVDGMMHLLKDYIGYLRNDLMPEIDPEDDVEYIEEGDINDQMHSLLS